MRTLLLLLPLAASPVAARQSPVWRGDPAHRGAYPAIGPVLAGLQWTFPTDGDVIGSAAVAGGTVYVGSGDGRLYAIDLETGTERWRADLGSAVHSTPAVGAGRVIVTTRDGGVHALDPATGRGVWRVATGPDLPLPWGHESGDVYVGSPTLAGGLVLVGGGDGVLRALDPATGAPRWTATTGGRLRSSPAVEDARVFVGSADGLLYAFALADGRPLWQFRTMGAGLASGDYGFDRRTIQSSPAVVDGVVYVGARDGVLYAVDAATGAERWRVDHEVSWVNSSPAVAGGHVYAGSSDARFVQAVDAATGAERWRTATPSIVWSSPAVAGDVLLVGDGVGWVRALDRATGAERWRFRTGGRVYASPVAAGALVIVGSTDGWVYAIRTGDVPVRRAVFHDTAVAPASWIAGHEALAAAFEDRGYARLDTAGLRAFLAARAADRLPSVVIFAIDYLPEPVAAGGASSLFRRYLESGGKVVWPGRPPLLFPRDPVTGERAALDALRWEAPTLLLGVDHARAIFDGRGARATAAGRLWGLAPHTRLAWGVDPAGLTVLAADEWGLAAEWVRSYGGAPGTGFVMVDEADADAVYRAAEFRPGAVR